MSILQNDHLMKKTLSTQFVSKFKIIIHFSMDSVTGKQG